jgi:hypothetical protein
LHRLRVLYVEDERLPSLTLAELEELTAKTEALVLRWFDYRINLQLVGRENLWKFFPAQQPAFTLYANLIQRTDIDRSLPDYAIRIRAVIARDFRHRELSLIRNYFPGDTINSPAEAITVASRRFGERLQELESITVSSGAPLVDRSRSNVYSYTHWCVILKEIRSADIVLTNSIVLGADEEMPIVVIARGGVSTGITDNNDHSPYQAAMMTGMFPFLSDAPVFLRERGSIPPGERLDIIATFLLHEFGHFLLRYDEHYDHPNCVHVAPKGLNYVAWHKAVRQAGPCPLPHRKLTRFDDPVP